MDPTCSSLCGSGSPEKQHFHLLDHEMGRFTVRSFSGPVYRVLPGAPPGQMLGLIRTDVIPGFRNNLDQQKLCRTSDSADHTSDYS